jgi:hypothetical protein
MKKVIVLYHHHTNTAGHSMRTQWTEMGMTELEGEEGSGEGRRLIKIADFVEEEHGRNFHGSRMSATAAPKSPAQRRREPGSGETNPKGVFGCRRERGFCTPRVRLATRPSELNRASCVDGR